MAPTFGNGKICYIQMPSRDPEESAAFYSQVFGWSIRKREDGSISFDDGVGEVSGMWMPDWKPAPPSAASPSLQFGMLISIMVTNAAATLREILAQGGKIIRPIDDNAPEITAIFSDPTGNIWGIYQHGGRK